MSDLIQIIKEQGYTLEEFANKLEVSLKTIYNWNNSGIVSKKEHRETLQKLIPEFESRPKTRPKKIITQERMEQLKRPEEKYYNKKLPQVGIKINIVKKSSP